MLSIPDIYLLVICYLCVLLYYCVYKVICVYAMYACELQILFWYLSLSLFVWMHEMYIITSHACVLCHQYYHYHCSQMHMGVGVFGGEGVNRYASMVIWNLHASQLSSTFSLLQWVHVWWALSDGLTSSELCPLSDFRCKVSSKVL